MSLYYTPPTTTHHTLHHHHHHLHPGHQPPHTAGGQNTREDGKVFILRAEEKCGVMMISPLLPSLHSTDGGQTQLLTWPPNSSWTGVSMSMLVSTTLHSPGLQVSSTPSPPNSPSASFHHSNWNKRLGWRVLINKQSSIFLLT